jgi:hypothetical protein
MAVYANLIGKTPDELRAMAAACYKSASDSFDRCDTDGYLSQWASEQTARVYHCAAGLAEDGWYADRAALFDLDGNLLDAELKDTRYGMSWLVRDGSSVRWVNQSRARSAAKRRAAYEKKGVRLGTVRRRVVLATGDGGGFNISLVYLADRDHPDVEVVSADNPGEDWS